MNIIFNIIIGSSSENREDERNHQNCFDCSNDMFDNNEIFYGKLHINDNFVIIRYFNDNNELKHQFKIKLS